MEIKTDTQFTRNIKCSDVYTESNADYTLPDYLGDVRKILFTDATLRPAGRFAGGDEVELSGVVIYNVVYLDSENKITSAEFTSDYDYSVKCDGEKYKDSFADTRVSNYAIRVVGPRKLSARASLVGSVRVSETDFVEVMGDAFDGADMPELNNKTVKIHQTCISALTEREFGESIAKIDGAIADELSVVHSVAEPTVESVELDGAYAVVRGKLRMCALIQNGDEPAYLAEKNVGFEENVAFENADESMRLAPEVSVVSIKSNVNPDEAGCNVTMNCILEICVIGEKNQPVSLSLDGYLKSNATENRYEDFKYNELVELISHREIHNAEIARGELDDENIDSVVFLNATPKIESVEKEPDGIKISGEVKYNGISMSQSDSTPTYSTVKFAAPFETKVNISCQNNENSQVFAKISANSASAYVSDNKISASCSLESVITVCEEKTEKILVSLTIDEGAEMPENEGKITVYYPSGEDTLFSVAKRFRTSTAKVARDNDLTESVFADENEGGNLVGVTKLLIY